MKDPSRMEFPKIFDGSTIDSWREKNLSSYYLKIRPEQSQDIFNIMRADIKRFFSLEAMIENVPKQCLVLRSDSSRISKNVKLDLAKTNFKASVYNDSASNHLYINELFKPLFSWLQFRIGDLILVNETGIKDSQLIQMKLPNKNLDINGIRQLEKYGFILSMEERSIPMLLIKDSEPVKVSSGEISQKN